MLSGPHYHNRRYCMVSGVWSGRQGLQGVQEVCMVKNARTTYLLYTLHTLHTYIEEEDSGVFYIDYIELGVQVCIGVQTG